MLLAEFSVFGVEFGFGLSLLFCFVRGLDWAGFACCWFGLIMY